MIQTKTFALVLLMTIATIGATATIGLLAQHVLAETNPTAGNPHFTGSFSSPAEPTGNPHQFPSCHGNPHGQSGVTSGQCPGAQ